MGWKSGRICIIQQPPLWGHSPTLSWLSEPTVSDLAQLNKASRNYTVVQENEPWTKRGSRWTTMTADEFLFAFVRRRSMRRTSVSRFVLQVHCVQSPCWSIVVKMGIWSFVARIKRQSVLVFFLWMMLEWVNYWTWASARQRSPAGHPSFAPRFVLKAQAVAHLIHTSFFANIRYLVSRFKLSCFRWEAAKGSLSHSRLDAASYFSTSYLKCLSLGLRNVVPLYLTSQVLMKMDNFFVNWPWG